jgi:hypothetical protein
MVKRLGFIVLALVIARYCFEIVGQYKQATTWQVFGLMTATGALGWGMLLEPEKEKLADVVAIALGVAIVGIFHYAAILRLTGG